MDSIKNIISGNAAKIIEATEKLNPSTTSVNTQTDDDFPVNCIEEEVYIPTDNSQTDNSPTVNSNKEKDINPTVNSSTVDSQTGDCITVSNQTEEIPTANSKLIQKDIEVIIRKYQEDPEALAKYITDNTDDQKSFGYYTILAKNTNPTLIMQAIDSTIKASKRGLIRTTKAIYFMGILRKLKVKTKFKYEVDK
jgi:hypothetical protein